MSVNMSAEMLDRLVVRGFESPDLDYKVDFDDTTRAWMEITKDICGMANYGGGFVVIGVRDGTFQPVGVDPSFHMDSQIWVDKVSKWVTGKLSIFYVEHTKKVNGIERKFPILRIHGSTGSLLVPKIDGRYQAGSKEVVAFRIGVIYTRDNTSTVIAPGEYFPRLFLGMLKRTAEATGSQSTPLEAISLLTGRSRPDAVEETLWSNLFPIIDLPDLIYAAETEFRNPQEIYEWIKQELGEERWRVDIPPFFLAERKIYSFSKFDKSNPLSLCASSAHSTLSTREWLENPSKHRQLVMLLNFNLKSLCWKKGFAYDPVHDRFFKRYRLGKSIERVRWRPYRAFSTRQLVYIRKDSQGSTLYCEHFAGRLKFAILGKGVYLIIEPLRVVTEDGERPLDWKRTVRIRTKSNFHYHNNNYLYDTKLWLHLLAGNKDEIHMGLGEARIIVSVLSISSKVSIGIEDDQHTSGDFLDSLKSEPLEYIVESEEPEDSPLTETSLEE